jgi:hypothetical protein
MRTSRAYNHGCGGGQRRLGSGTCGQVSPVTLSLNGNDINAFLQTCPPADLTCTQNDSHPSDAGYRALAELVWNASGYH